MQTHEKIAIASDHAGVDLKALVAKTLRDWGYDVVDLGTNSTDSVDYPDYAAAMAQELKTGDAKRGVLICGTGIGISIAANRFSHVRAALCHNETTARLAREHNDANVLAMGARIISEDTAIACLKAFLETKFAGGRHKRRVDKMS